LRADFIAIVTVNLSFVAVYPLANQGWMQKTFKKIPGRRNQPAVGGMKTGTMQG
jgi:hypothetical protein